MSTNKLRGREGYRLANTPNTIGYNDRKINMKGIWITCIQQAKKSSKGLLSFRNCTHGETKPSPLCIIYMQRMYQINGYTKHFTAEVIGKWGYCPPELTTVPSMKPPGIKVTCNLRCD